LTFSGHFQYTAQIKTPWQIDLSAPIYDTYYAPGKGKFPDTFSPIDDEAYLALWNSKAANVIKTKFSDGSILYLNTYWTDNDRDFLQREFWDQRWGRYFNKVWPRLSLALGPPLALLILGYGLAWVARGFRRHHEIA
jgi:hypothetical protein